MKGRSVSLCISLRDEEAIYIPFGRMCRRYQGRKEEGRAWGGSRQRSVEIETERGAKPLRRSGCRLLQPDGLPFRARERKKEREESERAPVCAHGGFNACKTRGVHWRTRSTTPEVTKPLNYRLVPRSSSWSRVSSTATARRAGESRYLVSYSRGI